MAFTGNPGNSWHIARTMLREGSKIVRSNNETGAQRIKSEWQDREERALTQYAELTLAEARIPGLTEESNPNLRFLFWAMQNRPDGFGSDNPSELAKRVAEAMVEMDLKTQGREWIALHDAADAGMSEEYIESLKKRIPKPQVETAQKWWSKVGEKLQRVLSRKNQT